jgi:very-short-patch-repair endonuclease
MINISCKNCKILFQIKKSHQYRRRFCSIECKAISQKGKDTWNKGLTKEDPRVAQYARKGSETIKKQFANGRKSPLGMTGKKHSQGHIEYLRERNGGEGNPFYGKVHSEEARHKISLATIKNIVSGNSKSSYTKPEVCLYNALSIRKMNFIPQYVLNNKFVVDAYLPDNNTIVQVDGDYWHNLARVQKKDKSFNAYAKVCGIRVVRLWEHEIYEDIEKCIGSL